VLHQLGTTTLDGASYTGACPERSRGDLAGNRKTRTDKRLGTTLTYAYDSIYQLLTAKQGTTTKESYTGACPERYSSREAMRVSRRNPVGNRLSSVGVSPYSYNSSNQPGAPSLRVLGARVGIHEYSVRYSILCYDTAGGPGIVLTGSNHGCPLRRAFCDGWVRASPNLSARPLTGWPSQARLWLECRLELRNVIPAAGSTARFLA